MSGYRIRRYRKSTYRKKATRPMKRRMRKIVAKRKAYGYDGIVKHHFIVNAQINTSAQGGLTPAMIGHHVNRNAPGTLDAVESPDWLFRSAQYK